MFKSSFLLFLSFVIAFGMATMVSAASVFDIIFPIAELGNCADKDACKAYCDELSHVDACAAFAKDHGIGDTRTTQKGVTLPPVGPGGCTSTSKCKNYCDDTDHFDECIQFAETHGLLSKKEIKQTRDAIAKGPGGCNGIQECKQYCSDKNHHLECADYAHDKGRISDSDYQAIKDVAQIGGPGGCKDNDSCHNYCQDPNHLDECLLFSQDHGFISKDDALAIRKVGFGGVGPGGCKGNDACRAFCQAPEHQSECIDFAEQRGFMSKEEAVHARKFAGKTGPGGCHGDECRIFCENPANTETCLEHAEQEGLLSKGEIERAHKFLKTAQEGGGPGACKNSTECRVYCQDQTHQQECFEFGKKQGLINSEEEKQLKASADIRKKVEESGGPGGCKGDGECRVYCADSSHTEECIAFASAHGGIGEDQARQMLQGFTTGTFSENDGSFENFRKNQEDSVNRFNEFKQLEQQFRGGIGTQNKGFESQIFSGKQSGQADSLGKNLGIDKQNFVGPGGCTSPAECIKYCSEHKDECFSGGMQNQRDPEAQNDQNKEGDSSQFNNRFREPPRSFVPQLRGDIMHEVKSEDLPQGFEGRTREEKEQFFKEKFQQFKGEEGVFPGVPSQGFPGGADGGKSKPDERQNIGTGGSFNGIGPKPGTGIFAPIQESRQRVLNPQAKFQEPSTGRQPLNQEGKQLESFRVEDGRVFQNGDANLNGINRQKMSPAEGSRPPQSGQFPPSSNGGVFKPPLNGTPFQGPSGAIGGTFQQQPPSPPSNGSFGSASPGGTGGFQPPPSGSTFQPPPPPSGPINKMPQYNFLASLLDLFLGNY